MLICNLLDRSENNICRTEWQEAFSTFARLLISSYSWISSPAVEIIHT